MKYLFHAHAVTRQNLLDVLQSASKEDLLNVPDGFNNNVFWNIAHCVATQQLLHYHLTGNGLRIDKYWVETYKKGTLPKFDVNDSEMEDLSYLLIETSKILAKDYEDGIFTDFMPYSTSYGLNLKDIREAVIFNNMHESLHYGYVLAQRKALLGESLRQKKEFL